MDARLNLFTNPTASKILKYVSGAGKALRDSPLPNSTRELVALRASQINGCAFCTDMHTKDATLAGETATRLHMVAVWREATVFTEAERAALELTEHGTRIPALLISRSLRRSGVDHTPYDTTSIVRTIEQQYGLAPLDTRFGRDARVNDLGPALHVGGIGHG